MGLLDAFKPYIPGDRESVGGDSALLRSLMGKGRSKPPTHVLVKGDMVASVYINHPGPARGPRGDGWTEVKYDPRKHGEVV